MKYLVVVQLSSGVNNATIFSTLHEAKKHLSDIASSLKYPIEVKQEDDECLYAKITHSDWVRVRIIRTERAEYRLVRHIQGEKDEERRFSIRKNAVDFVSDRYDNPSKIEDNLGEWTNNLPSESSFKLYAVILDPEGGSHKVTKRFSAATSHSFIFEDINEYSSNDEPSLEDDAEEEISVTEKKPETFLTRYAKKQIYLTRKRFALLLLLLFSWL